MVSGFCVVVVSGIGAVVTDVVVSGGVVVWLVVVSGGNVVSGAGGSVTDVSGVLSVSGALLSSFSDALVSLVGGVPCGAESGEVPDVPGVSVASVSDGAEVTVVDDCEDCVADVSADDVAPVLLQPLSKIAVITDAAAISADILFFLFFNTATPFIRIWVYIFKVYHIFGVLSIIF